MPKQVEAIRQGAQVVVGTPGRVLDHLRRKTFTPKDLRTVVLDESDEMLSMGFLPQINDILSFCPRTGRRCSSARRCRPTSGAWRSRSSGHRSSSP